MREQRRDLAVGRGEARATAGAAAEQALTVLFERHSAAVRAFVRGYLRDPQGVEDVVQETFLRAWRAIGTIDQDPARSRSYLFTTARNVLTDQWRSQQRRPVVVADDTRLDLVPTDDGVDAALERMTVHEALDRLSEGHRDVVRSLFYQRLSVAETARVLGLPEGTVKSRGYYALRALRSAFDEMGLLR